jgi:hypothetical protein
MLRKSFVLGIAVLAVAATPALAQNPHFLPSDPPVFIDEGTQLRG